MPRLSVVLRSVIMAAATAFACDAEDSAPAAAPALEPVDTPAEAADAKAAEPEPEPAKAAPEPEFEVKERDLAKNPEAYKIDAIYGFVTAAGKPVPGAHVSFTADGTRYPINDRNGFYWIFPDRHLVGDPPYTMEYGAEGHASQRVEVPELPEAGVEVNVELVPAAG